MSVVNHRFDHLDHPARRRICTAAVRAVVAAVLLLARPALTAAVPPALPYQGHVKVGGRAFEGTGLFKFVLLDGTSRSVWSQDGTSVAGSEPAGHVSLPLKRGVFSVGLGDTGVANMSALGEGWSSAEGLALRIWFSDGTNAFERLAPDRPIGSVPFAVRSDVAGTVEAIPEGLIQERHLPTALVGKVNAFRTELDGVSNVLRQTLESTNALLVARVAALEARVDGLELGLAGVSNLLHAPFNPFTPVMAIDPEEPSLIAQGYQMFLSFPAPGWTNAASANAPGARYGHTAVWTGTDYILWGGYSSPTAFATSGARYTPEVDQWQALSPLNAPASRGGHTAVFTGTEMLVWGGSDSSTFFANGARFNASTLRWSSLATVGAPAGRDGHVAVWTGTRMVVWGGQDADGLRNDGGVYDPSNNTWTPLTLPNPPEARVGATVVWTGDRALLWGGDGEAGPLNTGAQLMCNASGIPTSWQAITTTAAPAARSGHAAVWNTAHMLIWGGQQNGVFLSDGVAYDPIRDRWTPMASEGAPAARAWHNAVWVGKEMVVVGGEGLAGSLATSAAYDALMDRWRQLPGTGQPQARSLATAFWSGTDVFVFGGRAGGKAVASLQKLSLQPAWYLFRKP
jgi:hypothetical protein